VLTIALGSIIAATLTVILAHAVLWAPPSAHPELAAFYPEDFLVNLNATSFPSQSTAVYAAVAAGIYLGGHYLTDVLAGLVTGISGYLIAIQLETTVVRSFEAAFEYRWDRWPRTLVEATIFLWILQVATGFALIGWIVAGTASLPT
jgi:hypothetical protein